jgi:glutathione reductase (NADPH)
MTQSFDYDLFVIGAGSGGVRLARMSASMGAKVAVAEDRYLGGTCVNVGCVPKKLFVYASHVAEDLQNAEGFGWTNSGELAFNWPSLIANKNTEIARLNSIYQNLLVNSGAQIMNGRARFINSHTVEVNGKHYTAKHIVIATGSWPFVPDFPGKEYAITSNELFHLGYLPSEAIVVGGGYIAVEMAGILSGLGVKTTLVYRGDLFLRGFDEEIRHFVKDEIQKKGVILKFNDNISSIKHIQEPERDLVYQVNFESGTVVETGMVLYATGRVPHTQDLGLEKLNIDLNKRGEIIVDEHFRSSEENIFALGDVIGGMQLTPVALAEGMYLANYLFAESKPESVDYTNIATAVFCQPSIGTVGLSEEQAKQEYGDVSIYVSNFKPMKHTLSGSDERCLMKMIVDKATDKVLGIHMVGSDAGEIIQGMAVALKAGATKKVFDQTIGIHPTAAEEFVTMRQTRSN